ncbi:MAG: PorP/SprF family type IX secretion system membrane protein [Bacteroidales bacterium]|nr:PorP/SprF family type IX secretion system membrane protein [Bacteroidales bacterium]MCF8344970.1 PorP/SprF family type IX secretion system membrane protein [Bacteroidales bacterium]MCF8352381.1 PorP/SprF family type IX secretion system membrane protein [Bacteroidales bacterium]MCF8376998.1 PorP/SprF family type IX secretion system membrane protein [Bacteroidales bacterium]MCF8400849.1 PorP/SprF family type IX secretion system membrane protein [Bacteroidales bacterium]
MKRAGIYLLGLFFISHLGFSQVDPQISQFPLTKLVFNPAAIEKNEYINLHGLIRQQWTGFENAPSTQYFGISNYFEGLNVGLGLSIVNDKLGNENTQNIKLNYSYNFWLNEDVNITFGAGMGLITTRLETGDLVFENGYEPALNEIGERKTRADFDLGTEVLYKDFTFGLSCLHFLKSTGNSTNFKIPRHYFLYGMYDLSITKEIVLQPMISLRKSGPVFQSAISALVHYKHMLSAGFSYRFEDALAIVARYEILPDIMIGYSYDLDTGPVRSFSSGSHELSISARIAKQAGVLKTPRYFD